MLALSFAQADELTMLIGMALLAGTVVAGVTYAAAWGAARALKLQPAQPRATALLCLFIALMPMASFIGMAGSAGEPIIYMGPLSAAVGMLGGVLLARRFITPQWGKGYAEVTEQLPGYQVEFYFDRGGSAVPGTSTELSAQAR